MGTKILEPRNHSSTVSDLPNSLLGLGFLPHSSLGLGDLSPEPCYHFPPQYQCSGNSKEHFAISFPHMFECKDYYRGVKLGDVWFKNYKPMMSLKI
ncbi:hypothetical protein Ahy_B05g078729 [Arachis hypogaea]|uniref:Uncharacterized protein n=1 Tax=Arachis hypogaea TaxID=3818 RepID=A0A444Z7V1_ARAHY|nr:hypothetical protein Ahy_B05g078729 [Arachis hypogaea]